MRLPHFVLIVVWMLNIWLDIHLAHLLRKNMRSRAWARIQIYSAGFFNAVMLFVLIFPAKEAADSELLVVMWTLYSYLMIYAAKWTYMGFRCLGYIPRLWHSKYTPVTGYIGIAAAVAVLCAGAWGALVNRMQIEVTQTDVEVADLPKGLDGLRIAQISDLHVGTFNGDTAFVAQLVGKINALHPDIIVFTGDLVNRNAAEVKPLASVLSQLNAPLGTFSVLGNHDYGDYEEWPTARAKAENLESLKTLQKSMGWVMLNNAHRLLAVNGDTLALIGVENIGDPPFPCYGDLSVAYPDANDQRTKILLTHNPIHWDDSIANNRDVNIALTLSGHTHGGQMRVWHISPIALRYPHWAGLYSDSLGRHLYVNEGAGTVGLPSRIGATPEITILTLRRKKQ